MGRGSPGQRVREFQSMAELLTWIGQSSRATETDIDTARHNIAWVLVYGFEEFTQEGVGQVRTSEFMELMEYREKAFIRN